MPSNSEKAAPKCPKDADSMSVCGWFVIAGAHRLACTRPPKHSGKHHAHSGKGECLAVW
jgi:hypothetical protein